jgi:HSP20 family protein
MSSSLSRWRPFAELDDLRAELERLFDGNGERRAWRLAVDVVEEPDKLVIRADVPGMKAEDVKITIDDDVLTIAGEHEETEEEKTKRFTRKERRYGSFSRSMSLPVGVKAGDVSAACHDGVVEITVPLPEHEPAKRIEITPTSG